MNGIRAYGLTGFHCGECGRPLSNRIFGVLTGCPACDEVVTRHRCAPGMSEIADGSRWQCPECASSWTLTSGEEACEDCCAECGHVVTVRRWEITEDKRREGPRREPPPMFTPFRNLLPQGWHRPEPVSLPGACYRASAGFMVHVKDVCRCSGR